MSPVGDVPRVVSAEDRKPLWLYPNLLSLDAPLVAMAWLYVFGKTWRLGYLPWEAYASLGLVVWVIYVMDRLLDISMSSSGAVPRIEPRHEFHQRHRPLFVIAAGVAFVIALGLVVMRMPREIFSHLWLGGVLIGGFFGLSMLSTQEENEVPHAKNTLAGVTFAFGTALMAQIYRFEFGLFEMIFSREFMSFAVLCVLNISAIDLWEHAARTSDQEVRAGDELALTLPLTLLGIAVLAFAVLDENQATRPFFYAILTGAALLHVLNRNRTRYSMNSLRVLADVALVIPVLVFIAARGK